MPKPKKIHVARVTADGVLFPPAFTAAVLAMQRRRQKNPAMSVGEVQFVLDYETKNETL